MLKELVAATPDPTINLFDLIAGPPIRGYGLMNVAAFVTGALSFAIAMSFTPGPNNLVMTSAGARFGLARPSSDHAGVIIGFAIIMLGVAVAPRGPSSHPS